MDSLNSLLIGFYTLLSYSYSQRHTHTYRWVVGIVTRKTEKEKYFLFLFPKPIFLSRQQKVWEESHSICSQIQTVPIRTCCLCLLHRNKGHDHFVKNIGSRLGKHLLSKGISQKSFSIWRLVQERSLPWRIIPFLVFDVCGQYCFPKNRFVPFSRYCSLPDSTPLLRWQNSLYYPRVLLCAVDFL